MKYKRLPKGLRKYIAREKGRIRRETQDVKEQRRLVTELRDRFARTQEE